MMQIRNAFRSVYRTLLPLIYAKTNYKLFLKRSFMDIDERLRVLSCVSDSFADIVKPISVKAPFGQSMLVIAPHHDDEAIGCGGAMLLQVKAKKNLQVVVVSAGGECFKELGYKSYDELSQTREKETLSVTALLNIKEPIFLREKGIAKDNIDVVIKKLEHVIETVKPDAVFVPFFLDQHYEHQMTAYALAEVLKKPTSIRKIYCYEVWGLCIANVAVIIDEVIKQKQELITCYQSQLKAKDYLNSTIGINMYHSLQFGAGECRYVENFFEMPVEDFCNTVQSVYKERELLRAGLS